MKFPDGRLAVCAKCKKNYKTRDSCRVRSCHTTAPWSTAYICITLDQSCTTPEGKYVDKPFSIRMVQWQPFCAKEDFDIKTPVCAACKKTNRTRSFCRDRHKHRELPWCTVFVLLSAVESTDPSTVLATPSGPVQKDEKQSVSNITNEEKYHQEQTIESKKEEAASVQSDTGDEKKSTKSDEQAEARKSEEDVQGRDGVFSDLEIKKKTAKEEEGILSATPTHIKGKAEKKGSSGENIMKEEGDDINDIDPSRTFLVKVSTKLISIHWLDLAEGHASSAAEVKAPNDTIQNPMITMPPMLDPAQYYAQMTAILQWQQ